MKNRKEHYAEVVDSAAELADYFFDQEGGDYTLAIVCEILEALLEDGELPAAYVVIETACRMGDVISIPARHLHHRDFQPGNR